MNLALGTWQLAFSDSEISWCHCTFEIVSIEEGSLNFWAQDWTQKIPLIWPESGGLAGL